MIPSKVAAIFTIILPFVVILQKKSLKLCSDKKVKNDANKSCLIFSASSAFMHISCIINKHRIFCTLSMLAYLYECEFLYINLEEFHIKYIYKREYKEILRKTTN